YHANFYYLSGSPFGLFPFTHRFLLDYQFPSGLLHMNYAVFSSVVEAIAKLRDVQKFKEQRLGKLTTHFKNRPLLLIGDSGQQDPEAYATGYGFATQANPDRRVCIWIKLVTDKTKNSMTRFMAVFSKVPKENVFLFADWSDLLPKLPTMNLA